MPTAALPVIPVHIKAYPRLTLGAWFWQHRCSFRHLIRGSLAFISSKHTWQFKDCLFPIAHDNCSLQMPHRVVWFQLLVAETERPTLIFNIAWKAHAFLHDTRAKRVGVSAKWAIDHLETDQWFQQVHDRHGYNASLASPWPLSKGDCFYWIVLSMSW